MRTRGQRRLGQVEPATNSTGQHSVKPARPKSSVDPEAAMRFSVAAAVLEDSPFPLLAAAQLLLAECRAADKADPLWRAFLEKLSETEATIFERAQNQAREERSERNAAPLWVVR